MTFLERQQHYDNLARQQSLNRKAIEDKASEDLFKPQVQKSTNELLSHARPELLLEGPEERAQRMYDTEQRRILAHREDLENTIYNPNDYSFVPKIDRVSKILGRESSIEELYENRKGQRAKVNALKKAEDKLAQECSFTPKINNYHLKDTSKEIHSDSMHRNGWTSCSVAEEERQERNSWLGEPLKEASKLSSTSAVRLNLREPEKMAKEIRLHLAEKEEKRREILAAREIAELSECTFRPSVAKHNPTNFSSPVVVRGIARHLELKNLSDQKKKDKEDRERNAFKVKNANKFRRTGDGNTVVEVNLCCVF
jgi:hypothetical protein